MSLKIESQSCMQVLGLFKGIYLEHNAERIVLEWTSDMFGSSESILDGTGRHGTVVEDSVGEAPLGGGDEEDVDVGTRTEQPLQHVVPVFGAGVVGASGKAACLVD